MPSRGENNNNPGNLEASPWTKAQPGYVGSDGRFAVFASMADGIAAQVLLLKTRYLDKGFDTIDKIINRYGNDPGTADDASVANYKAYVAGKLGIGVNDHIGSDMLPDMSKYMRQFETGTTTGGITGAANSAVGAVGSAINSILPTGLANLLNGHTAARWTAVVIGIILLGLAVATILMKSDVVQTAAKAA